MSMINKEVSDFKVYAFHENDFKFISKEEILGKWSVFFFYPADFTFVCPTELEDLADKYEDFRSVGCEVYAVSTDTHFVHKAWHDTSDRIKKINYPMLADPTHALSRDFEVLIESDGLAERGTFIINPEGKIVAIAKLRGRKRSIEELAERYEQLVEDHENALVCIAHAGCRQDAEYLVSLLNQNKPPREILLVDYEPVTGSHVGPGALALFFNSKRDDVREMDK